MTCQPQGKKSWMTIKLVLLNKASRASDSHLRGKRDRVWSQGSVVCELRSDRDVDRCVNNKELSMPVGYYEFLK